MNQLMNLMKQTYWAPERSEEDVLTAMKNSDSFGAFDEEDNLVGFAIVVTDFVSIWYLCDVIVDESHRGQGIGKMLMSAVVSDERFVKAGALLKTISMPLSRRITTLFMWVSFPSCKGGRRAQHWKRSMRNSI